MLLSVRLLYIGALPCNMHDLAKHATGCASTPMWDDNIKTVENHVCVISEVSYCLAIAYVEHISSLQLRISLPPHLASTLIRASTF